MPLWMFIAIPINYWLIGIRLVRHVRGVYSGLCILIFTGAYGDRG